MGGQDFIFIVIVILIAHASIRYHTAKLGNIHKQNLINLWYYHLLFGIIFFIYISTFGGDAKGYWASGYGSIAFFWEKGPGTYFVHLLTYPFVKYLNLSFFSGSVLFALIGYLGLQFFYSITVRNLSRNVTVFGYKLFPLIFYLPNLHFWSSGVGKDTLSFFAIGLFAYSTIKPIRRIWAISLSLLLLYYVRPHVAIMLLLCFGIGALIDGKIYWLYRIVLASLFVVGSIYLLDDVMEYVRLDEVSSESIDNFTKGRAANLNRSHTGSAIDITSYPLPLKIFTFLYRPLFFDIHNFASLLASIENLFLLMLSFLVMRVSPIKKFKYAPLQIKALILFVIIGAIAFSSLMSNLGIILRMKNMMTPGLIIFILYSLNYINKKVVKNYKLLR